MKFQLNISFDSLAELNNFFDDQANAHLKEELSKPPAITPTRQHKRLTNFELDYIFENYHKYPTSAIAKSLHRTPSSVYQIMSKMLKSGKLTHKSKVNGQPFKSQLPQFIHEK